MVGSLDNITPLHHQRVLHREVIPSELSHLHLIWFGRTIYVKPLPDYLLSTEYYSDIICQDFELYSLIVGFLRSYCSLIQSPLDLSVAKQHFLISEEVTWPQWSLFRTTVLIETNGSHINKRYQYGELRLGRLNLVYRFTGHGLTYFTIHREYNTYFTQYFALFATAFAFVAVVLEAMQVVVGIDGIPKQLLKVSYRFCVAVLVTVCVCFGYIAVIFLFMVGYNLWLTRRKHGGRGRPP